VNDPIRRALLIEAEERERAADDLESNEEGAYTPEDIKAQRDRAAYLRELVKLHDGQTLDEEFDARVTFYKEHPDAKIYPPDKRRLEEALDGLVERAFDLGVDLPELLAEAILRYRR
jgi:hypothetical protein